MHEKAKTNSKDFKIQKSNLQAALRDANIFILAEYNE